LADDGSPLLIRLPSLDVRHIAIVGDKGAGKTTLLLTMIKSLLLLNSKDELTIITIGDFPILEDRILQVTSERKAMKILSAIEHINKPNRIIIFINNLSYLNIDKLIPKDNIHIVYATSNLNLSLEKFPVRIWGKTTAQNRKGTNRLNGKGDFIIEAEGRTTRFQAAYIKKENNATQQRYEGNMAL